MVIRRLALSALLLSMLGCQVAAVPGGVRYACSTDADCTVGTCAADGFCSEASASGGGASGGGSAGGGSAAGGGSVVAGGGSGSGGGSEAGGGSASGGGSAAGGGTACATRCPTVGGCGVVNNCDGGAPIVCGSCSAPLSCGAHVPNVCGEPEVCTPEGWCWENPRPQGHSLEAVYAAGPNAYWAVGERGTILRWNGVRWSLEAAPTSDDLTAVHGVGTSVWAVGENGVVVSTGGDGGWVLDGRVSGSPRLRAVYVGGDGTVVAGGENATLVRRVGPGAYLAAVIPTATNRPVVQLTGNKQGRVVGITDRHLLVGDTQSNTWLVQPSDAGTLTSLWLGPDDVAWAAGGNALLSQSGAQAYVAKKPSGLNTGTVLQGTGYDDLFAIGGNRKVYRPASPALDAWFEATAVGTVPGVTAAAPLEKARFQLVGTMGALFELSLVGGGNLVPQRGGTTTDVNDVVGSDPSSLLAVGDVGEWLSRGFANGRPVWTPQRCTEAVTDFQRAWKDPRGFVWGTQAGNFVARINPANSGCTRYFHFSGYWGVSGLPDGGGLLLAGTDRVAYWPLDGGLSDSPHVITPDERYWDVWTDDGKRGWAVGDDFLVRLLPDGGQAFELESPADVYSIHGMTLADGGVVLLGTGEKGYVYVSSGDGQWKVMTIGSAANFDRGVWADPSTAWLISDVGEVFVTRNGGAMWSQVPLRHAKLHSVLALPDAGVWVVGPTAAILRHAP